MSRQLYYVREWSESKFGGASMLHAEYTTYNPPHEVGEKSEKQDENNDGSGWACSRVELISEDKIADYEDLPLYN